MLVSAVHAGAGIHRSPRRHRGNAGHLARRPSPRRPRRLPRLPRPLTAKSRFRHRARGREEDAGKIGLGAGAGAVIGAISGDQVVLAAGTTLSTTLTRPLVVLVR